MEQKICLDTDFLANFLRNKSDEIDFIKGSGENAPLATTQINLFELYYGAYKSSSKETNLRALENLISRLVVLGLTKESARRAGEILAELEKQGKPIDFRDLLIGSIAVENGYSVKTGNRKHFEMIEGLSLA